MTLGGARPWISPEAEWGAIMPCGLGWPLECAVATVASACTGLMWARPEVPWIEVPPERSISDATDASREVPAIADDCSWHNWCSSLARRDCKVERAALTTLVLTERGCVQSCGLPSNFGLSKTQFENLFALRYILYKRTAFLQGSLSDSRTSQTTAAYGGVNFSAVFSLSFSSRFLCSEITRNFMTVVGQGLVTTSASAQGQRDPCSPCTSFTARYPASWLAIWWKIAHCGLAVQNGASRVLRAFCVATRKRYCSPTVGWNPQVCKLTPTCCVSSIAKQADLNARKYAKNTCVTHGEETRGSLAIGEQAAWKKFQQLPWRQQTIVK